MVPQRGGPLVVRVLEHGRAGLPGLALPGLGLLLELLVERAAGGVAGRDVVGRRQVPGLRIAVAVLGGVSSVHVRHDRHGPGVGHPVHPVRVGAARAAGRVGPVQRLVDGEEVRQVVTALVHQAVDPLHAHRPVLLGLDRQGRVVERPALGDRPGVDHGAVAPHGGRPDGVGLRPAHREDVLLELLDRDLVVVDPLALGVDHLRARHGRRDHQGLLVLGDGRRVERAPGEWDRLRRSGGDGEDEQD